jgi:hypothetical protein
MKAELSPITLSESKRLVELEETIKAGKDRFLQTGFALLEIHRDRLYRSEFDSFSAYCAGKWGFTRGRGYQLMAFASDSQVPTTVGTEAPATERQAREARKASKPSPTLPDPPPVTVPEPPVRTLDAQFLAAMGKTTCEPRVTEYYERLEALVQDALENASDKQLNSMSVYAKLICHLIRETIANRKAHKT